MANLTILINEKLTLDGNDRGILTTQVVSNVNNIDNRVVTCPTSSITELFSMTDSDQSYAAFKTGSFRYGRVTNRSELPIKLQVTTYNSKTSTEAFANYIVSGGYSFMISSPVGTGSAVPINTFVFNDYISSIGVEPTGSAAVIEYFIATT